MSATTIHKPNPCTRRVAPDCEQFVPYSAANPRGVMCKECRQWMTREYTRRWRAGNGVSYEAKRRKVQSALKMELPKGKPKKCSCCRRRDVYRSRDGMIQFRSLCRECYIHGEDRMEMW